VTCSSCGADLAADALFCEACGAKVGLGQAPTALTVPVGATDEDSPISTPTAVRAPVEVSAPQARTCAECGGTVGADGYCESCGLKAASERDHFREAPTAWVGGVCDRGIVHTRNEDAMALWADDAAPRRAVLVVCDGVSSSKDSDVASLAGARAAREVLRPAMPQGMGTAESADAAATKVLTSAAAAANTAVVANTDPASESPASCTFVAVTIDGNLLRHANIGDSRAYWFADGGTGVQLTVDDSMAQMLVAGGAPRAEAEAAPQAHAITKWLGRDSPDIVPVVGSLVVDGPGWAMACSDGLWNYASEPSAIRAQMDAAGTTDPGALALALVEFAKAAGGHDNITVALARVEP